MLKLGHIIYSNCLPVHAGLLDGAVPSPCKMVPGIPTELNRYLFEGKVDVSPSSTIEYAQNPGKYLILPGFSITSRTRAMSIVLESRFPLDDLNNRTVALTTASATSIVHLRIILELFTGVNPDFLQYEQRTDDPYRDADAVLTIGDLALGLQAASSVRCWEPSFFQVLLSGFTVVKTLSADLTVAERLYVSALAFAMGAGICVVGAFVSLRRIKKIEPLAILKGQ